MNRLFLDRYAGWLATLLLGCCLSSRAVANETTLGKHGFAKSGDVKIHYVTMGEGPLVVMLHGFPDYWYTWRKQMPSLAKRFQVVAIDQRGYNESEQPEGLEQYAMEKLVGDVKSIIQHFEADRATIIGHDWGGAVAWTFAMAYPEMTERLVILNLPHFNGLRRELATNPAQRDASAYAREFQAEDAASKLNAEGLASWVTDQDAKAKYVEAFRRSSFEGMLNYYKANYPRPPYTTSAELPLVKCPVLMIHGLKDTALLPGALNGTWNWVKSDLTLVTLPQAGHFVQQDESETVTRTIANWLALKTDADTALGEIVRADSVERAKADDLPAAGSITAEQIVASMDRDGDGGRSREEASEDLKLFFGKYDVNRDGAIDAQEAKELEKFFDGTKTAEKTSPAGVVTAAQIVSFMDKNHDQKISPDEASADLKPYFGSFDTNKDGLIDIKEARRIAEYANNQQSSK